MENKCNCWQPTYGRDRVILSQRCLGTAECETCDCFGDEDKCTFYPDKRKRGTENMKHYLTTVEMYLKAQEDGKTYKYSGIRYNKKDGFYDVDDKFPYPGYAFETINEVFALTKWEELDVPEYTVEEAEEKFGIHIIQG